MQVSRILRRAIARLREVAEQPRPGACEGRVPC
jgi:hypothetical protein